MQMIKLEDYIKEINEKAKKDNQYRILTSSQNGIVAQEEYFNKKVASKDTTGYKIIRKGQFTYRAMSDTGRFYINLLKQYDVGIVSPTYPVFELLENKKLIPEYLQNFFKSDKFQAIIAFQSRGSTRVNLKLDKIKAITLSVPTYDRQVYIVLVIQKVSELIALRKKQLEKLDELVKSRFVEMFGDPVRNSKNLPIKKLINLGSLDRGRSKHRPRNAPELLGGKYPLIQTGEVANSDLYITSYQNTYSELGLKQSKMWNAGTLCITIAANIAQTAILSFDACFPDSIVGFVSYGQVEAVYMHYWFDFFQKILESQAPQVAQKNINLKILSNLNVIVPNIEQQQKFLIFVNKIEEQKLTIQQSLDKLEVLKKALMQKYFG